MSDQKNQQLVKYKIVFIGDQAVGKSAILQRIIYDNFNQNSTPTVGIDFIVKTLNVHDKIVKLQLWDTAGQEKFRSLIPSYVRDCKAVICVFDLTKKETLQNLQKWMEFLKEQKGDDMLIFVLGNKLDLENQIDFDENELQNLKNNFNFQTMYKVSAKSGENVSQAFSNITQILIEKDEEDNKIINTQLPPQNFINNQVLQNKGIKLGVNNKGYDQIDKKKCQTC